MRGDVSKKAEGCFVRDVVKVLSSEAMGHLEQVFSDCIKGRKVDFTVRCMQT